jgi:hypothetical protein
LIIWCLGNLSHHALHEKKFLVEKKTCARHFFGIFFALFKNMTELVQKYKESQKQLRGIASEVKKITDQEKEKRNYWLLHKQTTQLKKDIYDYMVEHDLDVLDGLKIKTVMPSSEKKELKRETIANKLESILESAIEPAEDLAQVVEQVVELVL